MPWKGKEEIATIPADLPISHRGQIKHGSGEYYGAHLLILPKISTGERGALYYSCHPTEQVRGSHDLSLAYLQC